MSRRFVVVGNPVAHSLSPQIHQAFAAQQGIELEYTRQLLALDGFDEFAQRFMTQGGIGMNVTLPFKGDAFRWCAHHDENATAAQAVNTVVFQGQDGPRGHNTDGLGLVRDLVQRFGCQLADQRILLLGAGGASQGVIQPLLSTQPRCLDIANRTATKAQDLASKVNDKRVRAMGLAEVDALYDVVINATSLGLNGADIPLAPEVVKDAFCYDMVYGAKAVFQPWAQSHGAACSVDGLGMLVEQAAESFLLWHDATGIKRPATEPIYQQLRDDSLHV